VRTKDDEIALTGVGVEEDEAGRITVLDSHAHTHAGRVGLETQGRNLFRSLSRSPAERLRCRNSEHDQELGVAGAAERQGLPEGGLRRLREVDGTEDARECHDEAPVSKD
jgi:hypothetical protein